MIATEIKLRNIMFAPARVWHYRHKEHRPKADTPARGRGGSVNPVAEQRTR